MESHGVSVQVVLGASGNYSASGSDGAGHRIDPTTSRYTNKFTSYRMISSQSLFQMPIILGTCQVVRSDIQIGKTDFHQILDTAS